METMEAGKFRKYLAISEWSCLVERYIWRDDMEKKASAKS